MFRVFHNQLHHARISDLKLVTKIHVKPTLSTQLLRTVNSEADFTEQTFGFRLCKNFKSKACKKRYSHVEGGSRKHVVSNLEGKFVLLISSRYLEILEDR